MDIRTLSIETVYGHVIPRQSSTSILDLTTAPCRLNAQTRDRLQNNMRASLSKQLLPLTFENPDTNRAAIEVTKAIHHAECDLCAISQELAKLLYDSQPGQSSDGMIIVASGTCDNSKALAVMKLDTVNSVSHQKCEYEDGVAFDLTEISSLSVDKNSVFKAALFVARTNPDGDKSIEIVASDHQVNGRDGRVMANFFRVGFLNCLYEESPASMMKRAHSVITGFINDDVDEPEVKAEMFTALTAAVESNNPTFDLDQYLSHHVHNDDQREELDAKLKKNGFAAPQLQNDGTEIEEDKFITWTLSTGVRITGPKNTMLGMLDSISEPGSQEVKIEGRIVKFGTRKKMG